MCIKRKIFDVTGFFQQLYSNGEFELQIYAVSGALIPDPSVFFNEVHKEYAF